MKLLITGGTGFIGSHLVGSLVKNSHECHLLVRKETDRWRLRSITDLNYHSLDERLLDEIVGSVKPEGIIHLATSYVKANPSQSEVSNMLNTNILLPTNLLIEAVKNKVQFFVNTGTCFEYNQSQNAISEDSELKPFNFYASTKLSFEQILKFYAQSGQIKAATLRLFYPYGPKDNNKLVTFLCNSLLSNNEVNLTKAEQLLSYTYVTDIVEAYLKTMDFLAREKSNYEVFNIGNSEAVSVASIARMLEELSGKKDLVHLGSVPYPKNEIMNMQCNSQKAQNLLGWTAKTPIKQGLKETYEYYFKSLNSKHD